MSKTPSECGSIRTSKSVSPHDEDGRIYDTFIIAQLDDEPVFSLMSADTVLDDGKSFKDIFSFDPSQPMDDLMRSYRKYATVDGREIQFSIFIRIEKDTPNEFISKYIRDANGEIRKYKGRKRAEKYDEMIKRYREKMSKNYIYVPRATEHDKYVGAPIETGKHATRSSKTIDPTTEESDAAPGPSRETHVQPASGHLLKIAAAKARKELKEKGSSQVIESDNDEEDFETQTKSSKRPAKEASKKQTPAKKAKTPAKGSTPAKAALSRKSPRAASKIQPLKIVTVPSVRKKTILPPPKNPPRQTRKRALSPESVSSCSSPEKHLKITEKTSSNVRDENSNTPDQEPSGPPLVDTTFGVAIRTPTNLPSASNERLLSTFAVTPESQEGQELEQPTFHGTPDTSPGTSRIGGGSFADFKKYLDEKEKREIEREQKLKELIIAEIDKVSRRQYKILSQMKELKTEQDKFKENVTDLITSNSKMYNKLKLIGNQAAERKGAIAATLLRFFPLDLVGVCGDILLSSSFVQRHLPALIARQIELIKNHDVNKTIGKGIMHFLFSNYALSHFIIGDTKKSLKGLKATNRPIPKGVLSNIIPSVVEIMDKKVTLKGKSTKENVKLIRASFSDLFGNTRSTYICQLNDFCKDMADLYKALYLGDKVFFEANKYVHGPNPQFFSEADHKELMKGRDYITDRQELEDSGLVRKEKKKQFLSPGEAVMTLRTNVGNDQLSARETIAFLIDAAREAGENFEKITFDKECKVRNVEAIYKTVLEEKKQEYAKEPQQCQVPVQASEQLAPEKDVFGEESPPQASTSRAPRDSVKAIISQRKSDEHFPDRKMTTSSSNDNMVIDTDPEAGEEEVFEKRKTKKVIKKKERKQTKKRDEEIQSTTDEEEHEMSDGETSEEGLDDVIMQGENDSDKDQEADEATSAMEEDAHQGNEDRPDADAEQCDESAEHAGNESADEASEQGETDNNANITASTPSNVTPPVQEADGSAN